MPAMGRFICLTAASPCCKEGPEGPDSLQAGATAFEHDMAAKAICIAFVNTTVESSRPERALLPRAS